MFVSHLIIVKTDVAKILEMDIANSIPEDGRIDIETAINILIERRKDQNHALKKLLKLIDPAADVEIEPEIENGELKVENDNEEDTENC